MLKTVHDDKPEIIPGQKSGSRRSSIDLTEDRLNEALAADAFACSVSAVCL